MNIAILTFLSCPRAVSMLMLRSWTSSMMTISASLRRGSEQKLWSSIPSVISTMTAVGVTMLTPRIWRRTR